MNHPQTKLIIAAVGLVVVIVLVLLIRRHLPRKVDQTKFSERWLTLQRRCADRSAWHQVVLDADSMLDDVLKRRRYKGHSTGERLVSAQHSLSSNETVWFGHKLRNKIDDEGLKKISKQDTLEALSGFRQALKDLGALVDRRPPPEEPNED